MKEYNFKAHPTMYNGVRFRSRLEARWAAFFDLAGWTWAYEPFDIFNWTPDFSVSFPCHRKSCGSHTLFIEIKPYTSLSEFKGHPCMDYPFGSCYREDVDNDIEISIPADSSAAFGINPEITWWMMVCGDGGGEESLRGWVPGYESLWKKAGNITQWAKKIGKQNG